MTRAPLSQLADWQLENRDQDIRGWPVQDEAGNTVGTVREMIGNTDVQYVDAIVLDNGAEIPTSDIAIGGGVVYLRSVAPAAESVEAEDPVDEPTHWWYAVRRARKDLEQLSHLFESAPREQAEERVAPIVEEDVRAGKRATEQGGIRIRKRVVDLENLPDRKQDR
jgi:hypothetical protein